MSKKTRFSEREKKILLYLRKYDGDSIHIKGLIALNTPEITVLSPFVDGTERVHKRYPIDSTRRTALKLKKHGYVTSYRGNGNWSRYRLTDKGREKADALTSEIREYIEVWQPLLPDDPADNKP